MRDLVSSQLYNNINSNSDLESSRVLLDTNILGPGKRRKDKNRGGSARTTYLPTAPISTRSGGRATRTHAEWGLDSVGRRRHSLVAATDAFTLPAYGINPHRRLRDQTLVATLVSVGVE